MEFLAGLVGAGHGAMGLKKVEVIFYGEAVAQVSQRGCGCPIPGNIQGHIEQGSEQADLVKNVPAFCLGLE